MSLLTSHSKLKFLFDENVDKRLERFLSSFEFQELVELLKSEITSIPKENFDIFLTKANELVSEKNDTEYLALSLSMKNTPIWSEDPHFKEQLVVKIFTPSELIGHLKSRGYKFE